MSASEVNGTSGPRCRRCHEIVSEAGADRESDRSSASLTRLAPIDREKRGGRAVPRLLILAGTAEAAELARRLGTGDACELVVSFAGLSPSRPDLPGTVRVGGFGGPEGLARHLREERIDAVVDATHPFAARMRWNALRACREAGVPRLRVERPEWSRQPGDLWEEVASMEEAAAAVPNSGRVFLTIGRRDLEPFARHPDAWFLVRSITAPRPLPLARAEMLLARGPFTIEGERELLRGHRIDTLVTKNSGGAAAEPKLAAARELAIRVVMVRRPPSPAGPRAASPDEAVAWLRRTLGLPLAAGAQG
jgi:precorrin-6A/cobalt-precorrin-6A reductase